VLRVGRDYSVVDANDVRVLREAILDYMMSGMGNILLKNLPQNSCRKVNGRVHEALLDLQRSSVKKRGDCEVCFMNCQYR
jgi:hypothetical protein